MTPAVANSPIETAEASETAAREFDAIFREHADLVFGTAYGITARREDAEDVVQTVFIRLLRRDVPVQFHKSPKAYLYRAAVNQSLNILKTRKRHPTTDLADTDVVADTSSSERDEVLQRKLYEAIAPLPAEGAEILILRYLLEVVINTKGGTVEGVVDRAKAFVALVPPSGRRQNGDLYKTMVTNSQRHFRFEGVPPGSYKLFAWENIPANAHRNEDFLKAYESRGASITVQQGATVFQRLEVLVSR